MRFDSSSILAVLLAGMWLAGCKADPGTPANSLPAPATVPTAAPLVKFTAPVIVCFGDSLTAGFGVDFNSSYPADMQHDLDAQGFHYRVVNMGVSGETTKDGLARVQRVLAAHPELVIVEFGGNDGLRGLPISDSQRNLDDIVAALKRGGTQVVMAGITLPPDYGPDYVGKFNAMFPAVAKKHGVPLLPFIYKDVYGIPGYIQQDGVHATIEGNLQVAKNIEALILPLLRK